MKLIANAMFSLVVFFMINASFAQSDFSDLREEIRSGRVAVVNLSGNGNSSGLSIQGTIKNNTPRRIRINTELIEPIYLGNRAAHTRQNMIAFSVYQRGGRYITQGVRSFIELAANQSIDIDMVAYCADYEKDNPISSDAFDVYDVPMDIQQITSRIANYKRSFPQEELTVPAQVALWLGQGIAPAKIRETFPFSSGDERKARDILGL